MSTALSIKGIGDGLLINVPAGSWSDVLPTLLQTIDERAEFFQGAQLVLQVEDRALTAAELGGLRDDLQDRQVALSAVLSSSDATVSASSDLGIGIELPTGASEEDLELAPIVTDLEGDPAILVNRTLRSGHSVRHHGHVVILGDVNAGAEVVAGGNVIVWGRLRGVVHAGASGDNTAVICALDLAPTQLRISSHVSVAPERKGAPRPEIAYMKGDEFVAEPWKLG